MAHKAWNVSFQKGFANLLEMFKKYFWIKSTQVRLPETCVANLHSSLLSRDTKMNQTLNNSSFKIWEMKI